MIPELGHFSLIIALCLSISLALVPLVGSFMQTHGLMYFARPLAWGQFVFVAIAFGFLTYAFIVDDFSVAYVAANSNSALPMQYKVSAVWGAHEGSLLLWVLILVSWTLAVAIFSKNLPLDMLARVLSVMGIIAVGFLLFTLQTSNPFLRILPNTPLDGNDLNPLLQDFGLIVHPPVLYMGYVGFSVAFAFAIAALLSGRLDSAWARWSRPWTNIAWAFLTLGIALGSWWAYYELGWGGWWFWDPVENASFMPWLAGTALIHSLAVSEKRGMFKSWTLLLAIFAFSLSLLGTFLVRSGVLNSVHAFASDPDRGVFILVLLGICIGGSLTLFALRAPAVKSIAQFDWLSREFFLLVNNIILVVVTLIILLGTVAPIVVDMLGMGKISVGPPYFNMFFVPLMAVLVGFMAVGSVSRWKTTQVNQLIKQLWAGTLVAVLFALAFPFVYRQEMNWSVFWGVLLVTWLVLSCGRDLWIKARSRQGYWYGLRRLSRSYYGMLLAHLGVAVTAMGVCIVSNYTIEKDLRMAPGDSIELSGYRFEFAGVAGVRGPNYQADMGTINVYRNERLQQVLRPEKRLYPVQQSVMTEADIGAGLFRDLFVALGEPLGAGAWAVRIHYKPYVRWLWLGAIFMSLGAVLAVMDRRYRLPVKASSAKQKEKPATAAASEASTA